MTILPQPKKLKRTEGVVATARLDIVLTMKCDNRIFKAAQKLADEIFEETGNKPMVTKVLGTPDVAGKIVIDCLNKKSEGYKLSARPDGVLITGDSLAGAFYGIQTLRQMLESCGEDIECCEIEDKPDMSFRGFYHDASRGRVPTLEGVFKMIDFISYFKQNAYQLYIEHTFQFDEYKGIYKAFGYMTAEEILEIDQYCYDNFVDFIPSLSTFGHLFRLLESKKYKHLCELDEYEKYNCPWISIMLHHTINASDPEAEQLAYSLIDQYVPLFRSKYFNICCDETFDICNGKNKGKDKGALYLEFTLKIIDHLRSLGKTVMMWGDVVLHYPETLDKFPSDIVMLNWDYGNNPPVENITKFNQYSFGQIVCPGTACWNHFCENVNYAEQNITKMIDKGCEEKIMGVLNTSWGDYGAVCPMSCTLYGCVLGAAKSWNKKTKAMNEKFDRAVSELVYGDASGETVKLIRRFGNLSDVMSWGTYCSAHYDRSVGFGEGSTAIATDSAPFIENAKNALDLAEQFRRLPVQSEITNDLRVCAQGLAIINLRYARIIDGVTVVDEGFVEEWCERYTESWLTNDKPSELDVVLAVMRGKKPKLEDILTNT